MRCKCCDNGWKLWYRGTVIDAIKEKGIKADFTCSCGPRAMLKAVEEKYTRGYMSLKQEWQWNRGMYGMCYER